MDNIGRKVPTIYRMNTDNILNNPVSDKCIVLDLDLTLLSTYEHIEDLKESRILSDAKLMPIRNRIYKIILSNLEKRGIGTEYIMWGIKRPHLEEFLLFCFSYFKVVAVWSAGKREYVEYLVDYLFRDLPKPHVVFTYDDVKHEPGRYLSKPLTKMFESNIFLKNNMSLYNTFVLDDTVSTFKHNPKNGVLIPRYEPDVDCDDFNREEDSLLKFKYWLLHPEVIYSSDVRLIDKDEIFSVPLEHHKSNAKLSI